MSNFNCKTKLKTISYAFRQILSKDCFLFFCEEQKFKTHLIISFFCIHDTTLCNNWECKNLISSENVERIPTHFFLSIYSSSSSCTVTFKLCIFSWRFFYSFTGISFPFSFYIFVNIQHFWGDWKEGKKFNFFICQISGGLLFFPRFRAQMKFYLIRLLLLL